MKYRFAILISVFVLLSCTEAPAPVELKPAPSNAPEWSNEAIWYEILLDRFYNGDPSNDPTAANIQDSGLDFMPSTWTTTTWTQNWYESDPFFKDLHGKTDSSAKLIHSFNDKVNLRRYGGDLQGVINKLDYLENLGINAIYFNPIFNTSGAHKSDVNSWRHIDVNFGPDPIGDAKLIEAEDPSDISTWKMTSADNLFLTLLKQAKARKIRIILSGEIQSEAVKEHTLAVARRWLDPNADSDPSDGVDGFKLTSAGNLSAEFWREYRIYVKSINPQAYLVGDNSSPKNSDDALTPSLLTPSALTPSALMPNALMPSALMPNAVLQDDAFDGVFDGVMNESWFQHAQRYFLSSSRTQKPSEFVSALLETAQEIDSDYAFNIINMAASHNSPRLLSALSTQNSRSANKQIETDIHSTSLKPTADTVAIAKLLLLQQFTYVGAPLIWAGDEMGMWGQGPSHNQKPLIWPEYAFDNEVLLQGDVPTRNDEVQFDQALFEYYQFLVKLRRANPVLSTGALEFVKQNDRKHLLSYRRFDEGITSAYVIFNTGRKRQQIIVPNSVVKAKSWLLWHSTQGANILQSVPSEQLSIEAESAIVIIATH